MKKALIIIDAQKDFEKVEFGLMKDLSAHYGLSGGGS